MKPVINLLDLFSGAGGFSMGLQRAGFKIKHHWFSELDKHAIANYRYNFKNAEYVGSVTDGFVRELPERPNIITFGSPCQDFSLAGKRAGMAGQRSSLITHAIALIYQYQPDFFIWENVKGTFSSNAGADFWAIMQAFTNIGGYRLEWQLLNTKWFLPQNRERIYLVGHLATAGRGFQQVFPIGKSIGKVIKEKLQPTKVSGTINAKNNSGQLSVDAGTTLIKSATKEGYEQAQLGDSINYSQPNSTTRRGRIGKGVAQTLDTGTQQGVLTHYGHKDKAPRQHKIVPTLKAESHGHEPMVFNDVAIRRLTEIECERLQGFPDDWTKWGMYEDKSGKLVKKEISSTQRYKMMGNAVTVDVVAAVAKRLFDNYFKH